MSKSLFIHADLTSSPWPALNKADIVSSMRALFIDSKTEVGLAAAMTTRKGKRLSAGFDAQVVMDQGALHSRFSSVEFFALVTYVLKAKMSSILPIHGAGYCAYAFIVDDTPLPME